MHSSKGLSAKVVFIPGLEETLFPSTNAQPIPGLIFEGARLMYVAITRDRAACYLSYVQQRSVFGTPTLMAVSRYAVATGVPFAIQNNIQLTAAEIQAINQVVADI